MWCVCTVGSKGLAAVEVLPITKIPVVGPSRRVSGVKVTSRGDGACVRAHGETGCGLGGGLDFHAPGGFIPEDAALPEDQLGVEAVADDAGFGGGPLAHGHDHPDVGVVAPQKYRRGGCHRRACRPPDT